MRVIIVGAGDVGLPIIHYLSERGHALTIIELDETRCKHIASHDDAAIFQASGTNLEIWKNFEADKMDALLALTNKDEVNHKVCKIAKKQFGIPFVIVRANQPGSLEPMKEAGADIVICPAQETRRLFLNALESLTAEILYENAITNFKIVMVTIPPNGTVIGKTVAQLGFSENCRMVSVFRNGAPLFPTKSFMFKGGDKIVISGSFEQVEKTAEELRSVEIT